MSATKKSSAPEGSGGGGGGGTAKRTRTTVSTKYPNATGKAAEALEWAAACRQIGAVLSDDADPVLLCCDLSEAPGYRLAFATPSILLGARYRVVDNDGTIKTICYLAGNSTTGIVRVVGVLTDVNVGSVRVTANLFDGSATVSVQCWLADEHDLCADAAQWKEGVFVRVHGRPSATFAQTSDGKRGAAVPFVQAYKVEVVTDPDELDYHFLQAMKYREEMRKGAREQHEEDGDSDATFATERAWQELDYMETQLEIEKQQEAVAL